MVVTPYLIDWNARVNKLSWEKGVSTHDIVHFDKRVEPHARRPLLDSGHKVTPKRPSMQGIMGRMLSHINGMPMTRMRDCKHEIQHGFLPFLDLACIPILLKDARAVCESVAYGGTEGGDDGFEYSAGGVVDW